MQGEQRRQKFDITFVMQQLQTLIDVYLQEKQVLIDPFCVILDQFCLAFAALNSFLGIAFSDVKSKVEIIRNNSNTFKGYRGFLSFVRLEMERGLHPLNGDNNSSHKAPKDFKKYSSTARNLLRMMWLLTFIRVTFEQARDPLLPIPDVLCAAYDAAFGEKHSWIIRKGAKLAIQTSGKREELISAIMGEGLSEKMVEDLTRRFLERLVPIHEALWGFYREHKLTDLE